MGELIQGEKYYFDWKGNTKIGIYKGQTDDGYVFQHIINNDKYILLNIDKVSKL